MYGYIYLTTNLLNNRMYIGKHKSDIYDKSYYGSGKILLQAIAKYGIDNFKNEILYIANDEDELNNKEIEYIDFYRNKFGKLLYNIAIGGNGGDTFSNKTENEKSLRPDFKGESMLPRYHLDLNMGMPYPSR